MFAGDESTAEGKSEAAAEAKTDSKAGAKTAKPSADARPSHLGPLSGDAKPHHHESWPGQPGRMVAPRFAPEVESQSPDHAEDSAGVREEPCPGNPPRHRWQNFIEAPHRSSAFQSWLYRPMSFGVFLGMLSGGTLIDNWVSQDVDMIGGLRLGWDMDDYWGLEARYGISSMKLHDDPPAVQAYPTATAARHSDHILLDASMLYYPWGDTRCRPYVLFGVGFGEVSFVDRGGVAYRSAAFSIPVGLGVKYQQTDRLAWRLECSDTVIFCGGSGVNTLNDFALTAGLEYRFGGNRRSYWPWNPGTNFW